MVGNWKGPLWLRSALVGDPDQVYAKLRALYRYGHTGFHLFRVPAYRRVRIIRQARTAAFGYNQVEH